MTMSWIPKFKQVVIRTKGKRFVPGEDHLIQRYEVNGKTYPQWVTENRFSQSNTHICQAMLTWAHKQMAKEGGGQHGHDLIELYCGNGNFTLPLSVLFRRVFATELDKYSVKWVALVPKRTPEPTVARCLFGVLAPSLVGNQSKGRNPCMRFLCMRKRAVLVIIIPAKWNLSLIILPTEKCRCLALFSTAELLLRAQRRRASAMYA
jgi:hypothetical protein